MEDIAKSRAYHEEGEFKTISSTESKLTVSIAQVSRIAAERSAAKRLDYIARISTYQPDQLVFVDESSVDRRTTYRGRAWSIRGTKAQRKAFFVRGRRSVLAISAVSHWDANTM